MLTRFDSLIGALALGMLLTVAPSHAQQAPASDRQAPTAEPPQSIESRTSGMRKIDGFFPLYWDERTGSMYIEVSRLDTDFLFTTGLSAGLGSNDIGLDRGGSRGGSLVHFERVGPRVLLVEPNQSFRSSSSNPQERRSVEDSFARSVLWGFSIAAESDGRLLVDATDFLLRDVVGAARRLGPGNHRVDRSRTTFYLPNTKNFPQNTEIDFTLTLVTEPSAGRGNASGPAQGPTPIGQRLAVGGRGGGLTSGSVSSVTPDAAAVTLREHISFVQLPDSGYRTRKSDPRAGFGGMTYQDVSTPIGESMQIRMIRRHRLQKKDPAAAVSEPVAPIQYWVDPGAPEDIRNALIEGAMWWNQAFEAAGFRNAFKVDVLPADADPMDIRYNMINWVHRSTRGWSSGGSITDPRTGEIIKATVTLGSQRYRQDYMIFEGLLSPYTNGDERPSLPYETALKRVRQLAAHEVGHTLGLGHNYYDSAKGWISVMDYPQPMVTLTADGQLDISDAYPQQIGEWDKVAINYGYRQFPEGTDEDAALGQILDTAWDQDVRYLTNQDMDVNPRAEQWSNGLNQADELDRMMKVRRAALDRIGEHTIRTGAPMATVEEPLVPVFMYHRYAVEATASMLGGQAYIYAMRGDGRTPFTWESAENQKKALDALVRTLAPAELTVPAQVLAAIPPRPSGFGLHRELFPRTTGDAFDPLSPGTIAADVTIGFALQLDRAARLVAQHAVDPSLPGLVQVLDTLETATFQATAASPYEKAIRRAEQRVFVDRVMWLARSAPNDQVRAIASMKLQTLGETLAGASGTAGLDKAQHTLLAADITRFLERPDAAPAEVIPAAPAPPGAPIGDVGQAWLAPPAWYSTAPTPSAWIVEPPY